MDSLSQLLIYCVTITVFLFWDPTLICELLKGKDRVILFMYIYSMPSTVLVLNNNSKYLYDCLLIKVKMHGK